MKNSRFAFPLKWIFLLTIIPVLILQCEPYGYARAESERPWGVTSTNDYSVRDYIEKPYKPRARGDEWLAGTIYFKKGTATLAPSGVEQVRAAGRNIERFLYDTNRVESPGREYRIRLVGYPDRSIRGAYNLHLGLKRAEEVAYQLEKYGYPMARTVVAAKNDFSEFSTVSSQRVEVWVTYAGSSSFVQGMQVHIAWLILPLLLLVLLAGFFIFSYNRRR